MLRFADDIILIDKTEIELEETLNGMNTLFRYDLNLIINKSKKKT